MSFLRRIKSGTAFVPDWAAFMTPSDYARFRKLVDGWLTRHSRGFKEVSGGGLEVDMGHDRPIMIGLANLAQKCHLAAAEDWPALVAEHLDTVVSNEELTEDTTFDAVREMLKVRVYPEDYGAGLAGQESLLVRKPLAPGAVMALAIDFPKTVASVSPPMASGWAVPIDELFELGLANVRAGDRPQPQHREVDGSDITFLLGESFFTATWIAMLDEFVSPESPHGQLVAIPNRHIVAFMPILDLYQQGPGPITPNLYWRREGRLTHLPMVIDGPTVRFEPPVEFVETLNQLHKPAAAG
jgi:hypothetical protein